MSQPTVLILGANGRLGSALLGAFTASGWRVLAQSRRSGAVLASMPILADLRDVDRVIRVTKAALHIGSVDVVINAANPVYTRWAEEAVAINDASIAITKALGATLMLPGNVYNFGTDLPEQLGSDTPQHPREAQTSKGKIRIAMERALAVAAEQGTQSFVIRAGDFFGCGAGSWFDQAIAKDAQRGAVTYPGPLNLIHAWAYVPDLAATFLHVAEARHTLGRFENIHFAGHGVTGYEFVQTMQQVAQRKFKVSGMPWSLIRWVGVVKPLWRDLAEMSYLWQRPHQLVTDAAHAHLIAPTTPLDAAIAASLRELSAQQPH